MLSDGKGMKIYYNVLSAARANNEPIGVKYHLYDRQFKWWCRNKTPEEIELLAMSPKQKKKATKLQKEKDKIQEKINKIIAKANKSNSKVIASIIISSSPAEQTAEEKNNRLRELWKKEKMKALAATLEVEDRMTYIKRVGNGL